MSDRGWVVSEHEADGTFVRSFARGLDVLLCFSGASSLTVRGVAERTGLDRTTTRRLLATLEEAGFARVHDGAWSLTARTLTLGYAALGGRPFAELAMPYLRRAAHRTDHSCSLGMLDGRSAVFVARATTRQVMTISLGPGVRVPAHASAMGRVLLSGLDGPAVARLFAGQEPVRCTEHTVTDVATLLDVVDRVRADGWALVDQELEVGVRSVAAPVRDRTGAVVAAVSVGTNAGVVGLDHLTGPVREAVQECAGLVEADLATLPVPLPGLETTPGAVPVSP